MHSSQVILADLQLLELRIPILAAGSTYTMHLHTFSDIVTVQKIEWAIDPETKQKVEKPKYVKKNTKCMVRIACKAPVPLEKSDDLAALGRFTLRDEGKTIALGTVAKFVPFNKELAKKVDLPGQYKKAESAAAAAAGDSGKSDNAKNTVFDMETGKVAEQKAAMQVIGEEDD